MVVGIVVIIKKSQFNKGDKEEANMDLKRRVESLEKEIEDIKNK